MIDTHDEETTLIGAICQDQKMVRVIAKHVEPKHFFYESCRLVYELACERDAKGQAFDPLIAADILSDRINNIREFLAECIDVVPTTANTEDYAILLRKKSDEREFRERVGMALTEETSDKLIESVEAICSEMIQNRSNRGLKKYDAVIEKTYFGLFETPENRVDTGYGVLDSILKGLWGGELIIVAARPAVGKSAFALSIAENVAKTGKVVQFYSLEMEDTEVGERSLARHTRMMSMGEIVDRNLGSNAYDPKLLDDMRNDAMNAYNATVTLPIYIDDSPNVKPSKVRAQGLTEKNLGLIIVDYGGLMSADRKYDSRNLELGAISRDLKNIAKELKVPVIMLGQLNRGVSEEQRPSLRELRDSGELEQNANKCIFLWNEKKDENLVGVCVAKNRKGKTDEVIMHFNGDHMTFTETDKKHEEPQKKKSQKSVYEDDT